nr:DUF6714 family protein [Leptospira weilii]
MQKLNQFFIYTDLDFRDEFRKDLIPVEKLRILINSAFEDVVRGNDTTLHEAVAEDDYLSEEEVLAARKEDAELHWRDVPSERLVNHPDFLTYLDFEGLRYYLPAIMIFALNFNCRKDWNDTPNRLLDTFRAARRSSRCRQRFDVAAFANNLNLTQAQIISCYRFACYMAIEADEGVNENQYPAML